MPTYTYTKTGLYGPIFLPKKTTIFSLDTANNADAFIEISYDPMAAFKQGKEKPLWHKHNAMADVLFDATAMRINFRAGTHLTLTMTNKEDIIHEQG